MIEDLAVTPQAPLAAPPAISLTAIMSGLVQTGRTMTAGQFTYSIPGTGASWPGYGAGEEQETFTPLNASQSTAFVTAIDAWDRLIAPTFTRTTDALSPGFIRVGFSTYHELDDDTWGYAYEAPGPGYAPAPWSGDIWINADVAKDSFSAGQPNFQSTLHEIGHVLGLKHPFESPALAAGFDHGLYTVMSYDDDVQVAVSFVDTPTSLQAVYTFALPRTPMVLDIAAVQAIYGADPTTAAGPTTYAYRPGDPRIETIYDAGGVDTIDASAFTRGSDIDLAPGAYSSLGYQSAASQLADALGLYGSFADSYVRETFSRITDNKANVYTGRDVVGIALSTTIENAIGGSGNDTLTGNAAANGLAGGAGGDFIRGLEGDDQVDGGTGDDDVNGNQGQDLVHGGEGADSVRGGQGADTVYGDAGDDPHVNGNIGDDLVYGGLGNDTVFGGQGSDTLSGEDGNDWLSGDLGNDVLVGGAGADRFLFRAGSGLDWVTDFNSAAGDRIQLAAGTAYTLGSVGDQVLIILGSGDQLGLSGVTAAALGDWLVFA